VKRIKTNDVFLAAAAALKWCYFLTPNNTTTPDIDREKNGRRRRRRRRRRGGEEEEDDDDANDGRPQNGPRDASSPPRAGQIAARFGCRNGSGTVSAISSESSVQSPARRRVPVRAPGSETDVRTMEAVWDVQKRRREEMLVRAREFEREQGVYDCISHEHRVWAEVVRCVSSSSSSSSS